MGRPSDTREAALAALVRRIDAAIEDRSFPGAAVDTGFVIEARSYSVVDVTGGASGP